MLNKILLTAISLLVLAGCASNSVQPYQPLPPVKVITETVEVEIYQPPLPPEIQLNDVQWKIITNSPCKPATGTEKLSGGRWYYTVSKYQFETYTKTDGTSGQRIARDADGKRVVLDPITDKHGEVIEVCGNYQQKVAEVEAMMDGDFVVLALTPKGYEKMAANLQDIKRYINQQKEIIYYYREATKPKGAQGWQAENAERQQAQLDAAAADNEQPEQPTKPAEPESSIFDSFKLPKLF